MTDNAKDNDTRTNAQSSGLDSRYTPGPWQTDGRWISACDFRPGTLFIADCAVSSGYRSQDETAANARLIAAAPELLEACQALLNAYIGATGVEDPADDPLCVNSSAAIAKAEGTISTKGATLAD